MREKLAKIDGVRTRFTGTVNRFGSKKSYKGWPIPTLLLVDVRNGHNEVVTDHLWFTVGKQIKELKLKPGEMVSFDARVQPYQKGYRGRVDDFSEPVTVDYALKFPTNVRKVVNVSIVPQAEGAGPKPLVDSDVSQLGLFGVPSLALQPQDRDRAPDIAGRE